MRFKTTSMGPVAALLATAAAVAPAGARPNAGGDWYAGRSTLEGSLRTEDTQGRPPGGAQIDERRVAVP